MKNDARDYPWKKKHAEDARQADNAVQEVAPAAVEDPDAKRAAARLKANESLIASLAGGDFSNQQTRVAHILNLHPAARNSDVALALKYWETFQPELYNPDGIKPADFFKLDRVPFLVRARAKIQNEYELFQAEDKVRRHRKGREDEMRDAVLTDEAPRQMLQGLCHVNSGWSDGARSGGRISYRDAPVPIPVPPPPLSRDCDCLGCGANPARRSVTLEFLTTTSQ